MRFTSSSVKSRAASIHVKNNVNAANLNNNHNHINGNDTKIAATNADCNFKEKEKEKASLSVSALTTGMTASSASSVTASSSASASVTASSSASLSIMNKRKWCQSIVMFVRYLYHKFRSLPRLLQAFMILKWIVSNSILVFVLFQLVFHHQSNKDDALSVLSPFQLVHHVQQIGTYFQSESKLESDSDSESVLKSKSESNMFHSQSQSRLQSQSQSQSQSQLPNDDYKNNHNHDNASVDSTSTSTSNSNSTKVLYIVTALAEYNNGLRFTERGSDRFRETLIPIVVDSITSMISPPYDYEVDLYLILGFTLQKERLVLIQKALPEGVGLQVWDDAMPLGYNTPNKDTKIQEVTRALARQHRYVIKDKLMHYDLFLAFEDDMRISGAQIHHYIHMSQQLQLLNTQAPDTLPNHLVPETQDGLTQRYHGPMTKAQTSRLIPGFIRVEVYNNGIPNFNSNRQPDPISSNHMQHEQHIDPKPCCHIMNVTAQQSNRNIPIQPNKDQIVIWETGILGAVIRQLPQYSKTANQSNFNWILLQPGPKNVPKDKFIGGYWSGRQGDFGDEPKPTPGMPQLIAQQGGWMATRQQLIHIEEEQCGHRFFPPFEDQMHQNGLTLNNVEFWSGGYQLYSGVRAGCNMQRVISLHPDHFSNHLLYHTANNKQQQKAGWLVKADHFFGQLNTIVNMAQQDMHKQHDH